MTEKAFNITIRCCCHRKESKKKPASRWCLILSPENPSYYPSKLLHVFCSANPPTAKISGLLGTEDLERVAWARLGSHSHMGLLRRYIFLSIVLFQFSISQNMLREAFFICICVAWAGFAIHLSPWIKVRLLS